MGIPQGQEPFQGRGIFVRTQELCPGKALAVLENDVQFQANLPQNSYCEESEKEEGRAKVNCCCWGVQ